MAESWVTIATKPSCRALVLPHSISTTLIAFDQLSGNTGAGSLASLPQRLASDIQECYASTILVAWNGTMLNHTGCVEVWLARALPTSGLALSLSVLLFSAAIWCKVSYPFWKRENLGEWAEFKYGVLVFHRTKCRMGLQAAGPTRCLPLQIPRWYGT
jgi:hypothetical protein